MQELLKATLEEAPIVKFGEYNYFVHPITDGVPEISADLLREVVGEVKNLLIQDFDKLVTIEAMGIPISSILAVELNKPLVIIRKKKYGLDGEVSVEQETGYSKAKLFINGLTAGDRVAIVDDVISTGGTLRAVLNVLTEMGVDVVTVVIVIGKGDGKERIEEETGVEINTLIKADVIDGRVITSDV